jgi:hypothetical protein
MLDLIRDIKEFSGFRVGEYIAEEDDIRRFIAINPFTNAITFQMQKGSVKDVGLNGCNLNAVISFCRQVLEVMNAQKPHEMNQRAIYNLTQAYIALEIRAKAMKGPTVKERFYYECFNKDSTTVLSIVQEKCKEIEEAVSKIPTNQAKEMALDTFDKAFQDLVTVVRRSESHES